LIDVEYLLASHYTPLCSFFRLSPTKQNPNGWVYEIDSRYGSSEEVPPEGIIGAWKVDSKGNISGEFIENPNYKGDK